MKKKILGFIAGLVAAFVFTTLVSVVWAQTSTLTIDSPKEGDVISKDEALVKFKVEDFTITDFRRKPPPQKGQGHLHFWIDQENPTTENAIEHISSQPYLMIGIEPKEHTLIVELVGNDHLSLNPPVKQAIKFSTTAAARSKTIEEAQASPIPATPVSKALFNQIGSPFIVAIALVIVAVLGAVLIYLRKQEQNKENPSVKKPDKVDKPLS